MLSSPQKPWGMWNFIFLSSIFLSTFFLSSMQIQCRSIDVISQVIILKSSSHLPGCGVCTWWKGGCGWDFHRAEQDPRVLSAGWCVLGAGNVTTAWNRELRGERAWVCCFVKNRNEYDSQDDTSRETGKEWGKIWENSKVEYLAEILVEMTRWSGKRERKEGRRRKRKWLLSTANSSTEEFLFTVCCN